MKFNASQHCCLILHAIAVIIVDLAAPDGARVVVVQVANATPDIRVNAVETFGELRLTADDVILRRFIGICRDIRISALLVLLREAKP